MAKWRDSKLGDLLEIKHGFAFLGENFADAGTHIVLTPGNFYDEGGFKHKGDKEKWYRGPIPADYVLNEGDLIVAMTEQAEGLLGSSAIVPRSGLYLHNQRLGLVQIRDSKQADRHFVYYLFNSKPVRQQIRCSASGTKIRHTAPSRIAEVKVSVPPLPVQRRIAVILSAYDELMENSQRRIRLLETMARALYREWFVHFRFPGHEKVKMVRPHSHHSECSAKTDGDIPEGWEVKPFSAIASYVNGYPFKPAQLGTEGKPIIKIKELKAGVVADTPRNLGDGIPEKYNIHDGDVLFSWSADLDTYLWMGGEGLLNQHLFNVVPFDGISRAFCFHALKGSMPRFRALSLGATMHHIKRSALEQVFTLLPPAVVRNRFETLVEPMHQQLITLTKHVQNLRRTRDLLLPRLLSGDVKLKTKEK
jgi:type I restriction enzyme, S subunit